jgi:hypothetical protein
MTAKAPKRVRCAVYTRVSTEYRLDQEFNSLDAQHEAAEAYIRSLAHDGWTLLRSRYDDGGYSGGSTDRPAATPGRYPGREDRHHRRLQGRPAHPLLGRLRQVGGAVWLPIIHILGGNARRSGS